MNAKVSLLYGLNQNFTFIIKDKEEYEVNWNGISLSVSPKQPTGEMQQKAMEITQNPNRIPEYLKKIDIVPHRRGFFKHSYSPTQIGINPTSDDEVSTFIINDPNLAPKISVDLERILKRDFRTYTPPGTATVFFQSTDKLSRVSVYLVNDGFGVNQMVYILAKIHRAEIKTILIEEPEVHLHSTVIRELVKTLLSIIREEKSR